MHEGRPRSKESDHGIFIFAAGYRRRGMFGGFGGFGAAGNYCADVIQGRLERAQQVPPVQTGATGTADLTYDPATRVLTWDVNHNGLSGPATMAHFHGPATPGKNAPPVIWLSEKGAAVSNPIKGQATLTPEQAQQMMAGEWYINVHTQANPGGEIRGQVTPPKG